MMIGPAPMIRMLSMSVRLGTLLLLHQLHESIEQVSDVVRAGTRFGMALESEGRPVGPRNPLQAAVEQRHVRDTDGRGQRRRVDGEAMVLARDQHLSRITVEHRMVRAVMAELHLERAATRG